MMLEEAMSELLSLPRLARRLGITRKWLKAEADAGRLPCLNAGGRYVFDLEAVQEALAKRAAEHVEGVDHGK